VRVAGPALLLLYVCLTGCGYVGPVLPPSPDIPNPVTDLRAVQKGDELEITFSVPPRTTDSLLIKHYTDIDLAIGPAEPPFDFDKWSNTAQHFELPSPPPIDPDAPRPQPVSKALPAKEWIGKHIVLAVRTSMKQEDHFSQWSNRALLDVIAPLSAPAATGEATKRGYLLTWTEEGTGVHYLIFRRGPNDKAPVQIGETDDPLYVDGTAHWDTPYTYTVIAQKGSAQSEPSKELAVNHPDTFPPDVPVSVTALAGPESIEISWSRSPDTNLKGYYVYRSTNGGEFTRIGDMVNVPTFSDTNAEHGKSYRYAISAVSQKGFESAKSQPTQPIAF
jgi:predicted small lipoprotein YifL